MRHERILPPGIEIVRGAFCFQNALNALILIIQEKNGDLPKIYSVDTPRGTHAYLLYQGQVFNQGVTWINNFYPDCSLHQLRQAGKDVTRDIIEQALEIQDEIHGYRRFVMRQFGDRGIQLLQQIQKFY